MEVFDPSARPETGVLGLPIQVPQPETGVFGLPIQVPQFETGVFAGLSA